MAQTLWNKVRVAVLANLHGLLDRAVNTVEGYKQYVRDLEMALADLRAAVDEAVGTANGLKRDIAQLEGRKANQQADIDLLLADDDESNDQHAVTLQMSQEDIEEQIVALQEQLEATLANKAALDGAVEKLERKHQQMVNDLRKLSIGEAATKAKNRAADAVEAAADASEAAGGASIDNVRAEIEHRNDVANARFERVIGGLTSEDSPEEAAKLARAKEALEARRSEIAEQAKQEAAKEPAGATA